MRIARMYVGLLVLSATVACSNNPASPGGSGSPGGALGIIGGAPTGAGSYGNVGALLYDFDENGIINGNDQLCTGSLIAPTVVLTAGHCLSFLPAGSTVYVTFAADLSSPAFTTITATGFAIDPGFGHDQSDPIDIGVVMLPAGSTAGVTPLSLPPVGLLDTLSRQNGLKDQRFVNVGYGVDASASGRPAFSYDGQRRVSTSQFKSLQKAWLGLAMNSSATGEGGDCYGDSGGPKFLAGNTAMIVATVSWGDSPCRSLSKSYRLDIASARSFLGRFVQLP
jgi:hypothetical protein